MNRRNFTRTALTGVGIATLAPATLLTMGCKSTDLGFYIDTITGALKQLQPLLPGAAGLIAKGVGIASDLSSAYKRGDFASTTALFASLSDNLNQIADDAGVNSPTTKVILAVAGVALMTIANLLKNQAPVAAVAAARVSATSAQQRGVAMIEKASSSAAVNQVFGVLKAMQ